MVEGINEQLGVVGGLLPNMNISGVSMFLDLFIILIVLIGLIIIAAIVAYVIYRKMRFNKEIIIFESVNNQWTPTIKDKACEMKIGNTGDKIFYLSKLKRPIAKPLFQEGYNKYWLARLGDELIDFNIDDIDLQSRIMKVKIPKQELLLSRIAIHEALDKRYADPLDWIKKHLGTLLIIFLMLIFGIVIYLWFDKIIALSGVQGENARQFQNLITSMTNITDNFNQILIRMDNFYTIHNIDGQNSVRLVNVIAENVTG